ncbi:MAG: hypothetical protein LHW48_00300, partial [Candidatus Cloacimonetes bacterium]|nr:hypothetical protein [Candidatus Cloacimonadota bacterium]
MKKYFIIAFLVALGMQLLAVTADEFLIGAYSQYQIRYTGSNYADKFDDLGGFLHSAGYNATTYSLTNDHSDKLQNIFATMDSNSVKSMLIDNTWLSPSGEIGLSSLSFANKLQIEAEYQFKTSEGSFVVDNLTTANELVCMESYDYVTMHECGTFLEDFQYSNDHAWLCDSAEGHLAGMALSHPRRRWKPGNKDWPSMLSKDILFIREALQDPNSKLYISVAMRFADLAPGDPVASISLKLHNPPAPDDYDEYAIYDTSTYVNVPLTPIDGSSYGTNITEQTPSSIQDDYGNYLFEYYVDLSAVTSSMTGNINSSTRQFYHINPEVYWHGNGKLVIDYIVIEDGVNRSVRQNPASPYLNYLESHINSMESVDTHNNLLYLYGKDEPRAGQLQIYKHTQNYLKTLTPPRKSITAVWLKDYDLIKHDNIRYNYQKRFLSEVNPDRIMVDIFPLQGNITWNNDMSPGQSVQSRIDNMVHYFYHKLVTNIRDSTNPDTEVFYVPQTFGNVLSATDMWSYNMPPHSMIKALKFLPLCYAADGTVDFCVAINPNIETEKGNWVTPLSHDLAGGSMYNNLRITDHVSAYNMITDANEKIAKYGPIIRNLNWLNANKLMTSGMKSTAALDHDDQISLNSLLLNDLHVEAEVDATGYTGYVQCGYYLDSMGMPYYMLVNRRSVYKRAGSEIPPGTPLKSVDLFFNDAEPQEVCFEPDNNSHNIFGTHVA